MRSNKNKQTNKHEYAHRPYIFVFTVFKNEGSQANIYWVVGRPTLPGAYPGGHMFFQLDQDPEVTWTVFDPIPTLAFWASFSTPASPGGGPASQACPAGLVLRAQAAPKRVRAGRTVRFGATMTFKPTNKSVSAFGNAGLTVTLPGGVHFVRSRESPKAGGGGVASGSTVVFPDAPLKAGKRRKYLVYAKVLPGTPPGSVLSFGVGLSNCPISVPNAAVSPSWSRRGREREGVWALAACVIISFGPPFSPPSR